MTTNHKSLGAYHHGDLRHALLQAALEVLETQGQDALGFRELARRTGVTAAAPYRHFDSRLALLESLAVVGYQRLGKAMNPAPPDPTRAYIEFALANPKLFALMFSPELTLLGRPTLAMATNAAFASLRHTPSAWAKAHGLAMLLVGGQLTLSPAQSIDDLLATLR